MRGMLKGVKQFIDYFKIMCNCVISLFNFCNAINENKSCNKIKDLEKKIQKCKLEKCELIEVFNERIDTIEDDVNKRLTNKKGVSTNIELVDFRFQSQS